MKGLNQEPVESTFLSRVEGRGYFFECRGYIAEGPYFTKGKRNQIIVMEVSKENLNSIAHRLSLSPSRPVVVSSRNVER